MPKSTTTKTKKTNSDEDYNQAKKRVEDIKGFYSHLLAYLFVNVILLTLNIVTSPGRWWFYWTSVFWGLGLLIHFATTYVFYDFMGPEWEERKIQEILKRKK
jgi:hypothetical protein